MSETVEPETRRRSETRQRKAHLPTVRVTDAELAAIMAVFAASGFRSFGSFTRAALAKTRTRSAAVDRVELGRVLAALGPIGSNANQLARAYNIRGDLPEPPDLVAIRADLDAMRAALMKALGHGD